MKVGSLRAFSFGYLVYTVRICLAMFSVVSKIGEKLLGEELIQRRGELREREIWGPQYGNQYGLPFRLIYFSSSRYFIYS